MENKTIPEMNSNFHYKSSNMVLKLIEITYTTHTYILYIQLNDLFVYFVFPQFTGLFRERSFSEISP